MLINQVAYYDIPNQTSIVETMHEGSFDSYVFCAPETIE